MVAAGQIIRASDDVLLTRMGCRLRRVAVQSVTSGALTAISWDTEDEDTHGFITVTGSSIVIPANCDGLYDITFAGFPAGTSGRNFIELAIVAAATGVPAHMKTQVDLTEDNGIATVCNVPLVGGDTVAGQYFQASGSSVNITAWITCYRKGV